jgi:phage shock protein A
MADDQPENLVLQLLRDMRGDIADVRQKMATKDDVADLRSEIHSELHSLRADVASDLLTTRKELSEQIVGLRRAVVEYHSAVIGHGNIIAELEARLRRVEQRLGLDEH